ncbi:guanylate kinase [Novosphingopyxis sp. YJ-S2-01]|uniref:guanylate kinase n=1 Tax=Novosphingopyxis sp. YJ-S2-01 TaxID=2794021 RepID=UPI0018DCBBD7|nr:guanylate kinase [Novosphingopyxis sp. YJ-S2-01]MBH9538866.1 guanylate kinase [Novosphingopyxis sp. YJ-S2-01]|tara:strand:- start:1817 stop:2455 length:639 start_codon:yes stop_codon:yes gene_type:complete
MADRIPLQRYGVLFVLSSPSGAGKSTIARMLMKSDPQIALSVSATTRKPRPNEKNGVDYHFVSDEEFDQLVSDDAFLEWAHVFDHRYGTLKASVEKLLEDGKDVLFDIDWQGAQQLHQRAGSQVAQVFILPPSIEELRSRLKKRASDSDEVIAGRMARARAEISHWDGYDYVVVNDDVERCFTDVQTILRAERMRRRRQTGLIEFARELMTD